jgi:hypothetical protein
MERKKARGPKTGKRRTTLTLPSESLAAAARIAAARKVNLSTAIAEIIDEGLRAKAAAARGGQVLESYRRAFSGFTDEETMLLDGIVLDERADR